jgi:hypothetical protein
MKIQISKSMSAKNGLDTVTYGVNNGGVIKHDANQKYFIFGPAMSATSNMKNTTDPIKYIRFDGAANSTWDFFNHALCDIDNQIVIESAVS